jgi:hypothetical protein
MNFELLPDKALSTCWSILDKIELGQKILISQYAPNKPDLFIECAKKYADCYGTILFSDDYQEIKKVKTFKQNKNLFAELKNNSVILSLK